VTRIRSNPNKGTASSGKAKQKTRDEKDLAFEYLEKAVHLPSYTITTYGQLKLLPFWDPLRGDPRFEQIVASLAPKE
jgi:hypothetical protein